MIIKCTGRLYFLLFSGRNLFIISAPQWVFIPPFTLNSWKRFCKHICMFVSRAAHAANHKTPLPCASTVLGTKDLELVTESQSVEGRCDARIESGTSRKIVLCQRRFQTLRCGNRKTSKSVSGEGYVHTNGCTGNNTFHCSIDLSLPGLYPKEPCSRSAYIRVQRAWMQTCGFAKKKENVNLRSSQRRLRQQKLLVVVVWLCGCVVVFAHAKCASKLAWLVHAPR